MEHNNTGTAAWTSIEDVARSAKAVDARIAVVLGQVMAQRRSMATACDYVRTLAPGVRANCWSISEAAGHESWHRMQALLRSYRWDWKELRDRLPADLGNRKDIFDAFVGGLLAELRQPRRVRA